MKETYREQERNRRISEIMQTLTKLKEANLTYELSKFTIEICARYGVTERRAKEYIKIAEFKLSNVQQN